MGESLLESRESTEIISDFEDEVARVIEETYREQWGEELEMKRQSSPATCINSSNFSLSTTLYDDELEFTLSVHDAAYSVEDVLHGTDTPDFELLSDAYASQLNPGRSPGEIRTRFLQFSPNLLEDSPENFEDRWYAFNKSAEEALGPEETFSLNGYDHVYVFPLQDTV